MQKSVGIQVITLDLLVSKLRCILCGHLQEIMRFLGYPILASKKQKQFEYHVDLLKDNRKDLEGVQGDMNPSEEKTRKEQQEFVEILVCL